MFTDLRTVVWKEWIEWKRQYGTRLSSILVPLGMLIVFGLILPLQFGVGWFSKGQALYAWLSLPVLLLLRAMGDAFAGERERHTLETLLATRLPNSILYLGKMLVPIGWTWLFTQAVMLIALVPVYFLTSGSESIFYSAGLWLSGLLLSFLSSIYSAASGIFLSLRAETADSANQSMFLFLLLFGVILGTVESIYQYLIPGSSILSMAPALSAVFLLIDLTLLALVVSAFHRKRMIF